jgi:hypothetical protein
VRLPLAVLAGAAIAACYDMSTMPRSANPAVVSGPKHVASDANPEDSPDNVVLQLPPPDRYDGGSGLSGDLARYPHPTVVRAEVTGFVTYTPNYANIGPSQGPFGPSGNTVLFYWDGNSLHRTDFVDGGYVEPKVTKYITFVGTGELFTVARGPLGTLQLDGYRPVIPGPFIFCGRPYGNPCFEYGGNAGTFVLTRLQSDLTVTPEFTEVERDATPYIDYRADPMVVEGQQIPFVVASSDWVPDPDQDGDPTDVEVHAQGRGACQAEFDPACRRRILGSGTFTLSAWVNGKLLSKSVHITMKSNKEKVKITPISDMLLPTVTVAVGLCDQRMTHIETRNLRFTVTKEDGTPVANRRVHVTLTARDGEGGHVASEHATPRPWGEVDSQDVMTDASGKAKAVWTLPEFGGGIDVKADLPDVAGDPSDQITVQLGVSGLKALAAGTKYEFTGIKTMHPESHYGTATLNSELVKLADSTYASMNHLVVGYNDMSLPLGGRFDVTAKGAAGGQWNASPNHCSHRRGDAVDFDSQSLTSDAQRRQVLKFWVVGFKHSKVDEGDHFHLKLTPTPPPQ